MKKSIYLYLIIVSWSNYCLSQTISIQNSTTFEPIAFVNIALENGEGSFTSDENGLFQIPNHKKSKSLIFDAIGYEPLQVGIDKIKNPILLTQKVVALKEVVISKQKKTVQEIGSLKGKNTTFCLFDLTDDELKPCIIAKYFDLKSDNDTVLLKTIKIRTSSPSLKPLINFRIYSKGKNGEPDETLYNENILYNVKKGDHTTTINVSNLGIAVPKSGFFVALEILIIDKNKEEDKYVYKNVEHTHKFYYPLIKMNDTKTYTDTWLNFGTNWQKNNYLSLLMELELEE